MESDRQSHNCQRKANSLWVEGPLFPSVTSSHILGAVCISHGLSGHSDTEHSRQTRAGLIFCSAQDSALSTCSGEGCVYLFIYSVSCARSLGAQKAWCTCVKRTRPLPPRSFAPVTDRYSEFRAEHSPSCHSETRWEGGQGLPDSTWVPRRFLFSGQPKDLPCRWLSMLQRRREVSGQEAEKVAHELRVLYIQDQELMLIPHLLHGNL